MLVYGKVLLKMLDAMTVINPHLEGNTRTGTLPLTTEVHQHIKSPYDISTWQRWQVIRIEKIIHQGKRPYIVCCRFGFKREK